MSVSAFHHILTLWIYMCICHTPLLLCAVKVCMPQPVETYDESVCRSPEICERRDTW